MGKLHPRRDLYSYSELKGIITAGRPRATSEILEERLTFIFIIIYAVSVHLSVRVRSFPVLHVITIQVGELGKQLEHTLSVVIQVCHFTVEQVQTLQVIQLFLLIKYSKVLG